MMFLRQHPLCVDPFGVHCGTLVPATDVDHVVARRAGGSERDDNLQALCHGCHTRKTNLEMRGAKTDEGGDYQISGILASETGGASKHARQRN